MQQSRITAVEPNVYEVFIRRNGQWVHVGSHRGEQKMLLGVATLLGRGESVVKSQRESYGSLGNRRVEWEEWTAERQSTLNERIAAAQESV